MLELKRAGAEDFLFLFEAIQDVAILDSDTAPTQIEVIQVKKDDRREWTWAKLTGLSNPVDPTKSSKKSSPGGNAGKSRQAPKPLSAISGSPVGKLFAAMAAIDKLDTSARFVSNAGCDIPLRSSGNAATSVPASAAELAEHYGDLLQNALDHVRKPNQPKADLSKLRLEKSELAIDDAQRHLIGHMAEFLHEHSHEHAGQATSLVAALLLKIGPLCSKTAKAKTLETMAPRHGFSLKQFNASFADLQSIPDIDLYRKAWLNDLSRGGMGLVEVTRINTAMALVQRRVLDGTSLPDEPEIITTCDHWIDDNPDVATPGELLERGIPHLQVSFPRSTIHDLRAHLLMRAIEKCADLN